MRMDDRRLVVIKVYQDLLREFIPQTQLSGADAGIGAQNTHTSLGHGDVAVGLVTTQPVIQDVR